MRSLSTIGTAFLLLQLSLPTWSAPSSSSTQTPFAFSKVSVVSISTTSHHKSSSTSHRASITAGQAVQPSSSSKPRHHGVTKDQHKTRQSLIIALAVIGGLTGLIFLIAMLRCSIKFKKAPKRDRVAEIVQRHNLDCEMNAIGRNPLGMSRSSPREPAPPYTPRPPSYSQAVSPPSALAVTAESIANNQPPSPSPNRIPETPPPTSLVP